MQGDLCYVPSGVMFFTLFYSTIKLTRWMDHRDGKGMLTVVRLYDHRVGRSRIKILCIDFMTSYPLNVTFLGGREVSTFVWFSGASCHNSSQLIVFILLSALFFSCHILTILPPALQKNPFPSFTT